jgi:prevent-host-death family protein
MFEIHRRPSRDLRNNYPELARIVREHNDVVITNKGETDIVMVNPADWEEFKAYRYSQYVLKKIREVEAVENDPATWMDEESFWKKAETL